MPKIDRKYSIKVKPIAKIARFFAPNNLEITKGSSS